MLTQPFNSRSKSKSSESTHPQVIDASVMMNGMSLEESSSYLRRFISSPDEQSKIQKEIKKINQAVREFHNILDDNEIQNTFEVLNSTFSQRYEEELKSNPQFLIQLSRNLSQYYNRHIYHLNLDMLSEDSLQNNISVRKKKIIGSGFLKQYVKAGDARYAEIALTIDIILIKNSIESLREQFKLLLESSHNDYVGMLKAINSNIKLIEETERELSLIMELAFANLNNVELAPDKSKVSNAWCNDRGQVNRVALNLHNLHLSFIHAGAFKARLLELLGDKEGAARASKATLNKVTWVMEHITILLSKTTHSEEKATIELLRNSDECKKIIIENEAATLESQLQFACYQTVTKERVLLPNIEDVIEVLESNKPNNELSDCAARFSKSLDLYYNLSHSYKDKDILMNLYRHCLSWVQWFGGLNDKQNISGKICLSHLNQMGLQLQNGIKKAIIHEKEENIKLEAKLAEEMAEKASALLIQEEEEQKIAQAKVAQKDREQKAAQAREEKARKQVALQKRKKSEALKKEKELLRRQEDARIIEQKRAEQEKAKKERERYKRELAVKKKKEKRARQRERSKIKKVQQNNLESANIDSSEARRDFSNVAKLENAKSDSEASKIENARVEKIGLDVVIEGVESLLITASKKTREENIVDNLDCDISPKTVVELDQVKEWVELRCKASPLKNIFIPDYVVQLMLEIENKGYHIALYGGFPRDSLLKCNINDYDLVTDCPIEVLKTVRGFEATQMPNCYTFGPFMDICVLPNFDLVEFSKARYLAANALFATREGNVFAATDEIYSLFKSSELLETGDIRAAFENDPSRILRTVYYASHTKKLLTRKSIAAMVDCSALISEKVPFGVVRARLGDLFLRANARQNFDLLLKFQIAHHIVAGLGSGIFKYMNANHDLYQFIADKFSEMDYFISIGNTSKNRYDALALLLLPYHEDLLYNKIGNPVVCARLAVDDFCQKYSIPDIEGKKLINRLAPMINNYGAQYSYVQAKRQRALSTTQSHLFYIEQPAAPVLMFSSSPCEFARKAKATETVNHDESYEHAFPKLGRKGSKF